MSATPSMAGIRVGNPSYRTIILPTMVRVMPRANAARNTCPIAKGTFDPSPRSISHRKRGRAQAEHHPSARRSVEPDAGEGEQRLVPEIGAVAHQSERDGRSRAQPLAAFCPGRRERDQQRRTAHRRQRPETRQRHAWAEIKDRESEQRQADQSQSFRQRGRERQFVLGDQRDNGAESEFPGARGQKIKIGLWVDPRLPIRPTQTDRGERRQQ